jgi:hypothetical protein
MTLVALPQITPPPTRVSNAALLTNIAALHALNPREMKALRVYVRMKEVANDASSPLTGYDPATEGAITALFQDAKAVYGSIPIGDLPYAALAVDIANCKAVYGALSYDVNTLRGLLGRLVDRTEDELDRAAAYLRLEIGE